MGELTGLRRKRVDLLRRTMTVAEQLTAVDGKIIWGEPKTRAGRRTKSISAFLAKQLQEQLAERSLPGPDGLVFPNSAGNPRQALHKRVVGGSVLGLPGRGTTWFPVWQFDMANHRVLPEAAAVIAAFRRGLDSFNPLVVASWATTEQPELGMAPEEWLAAGKDPAEVVRVARRAAAELSQRRCRSRRLIHLELLAETFPVTCRDRGHSATDPEYFVKYYTSAWGRCIVSSDVST